MVTEGRRAGAWGQSGKKLRKQRFPIYSTSLYLVTLQALVIIILRPMFCLNRGAPSVLLPTA